MRFTVPPAETVEPFGKIAVTVQPDGSLRVRAAILQERAMEGAVTGIAIDGSGTMLPSFGAQGGRGQNIVAPFARQMCAYLARWAVDGTTTAVYWATGTDGRAIEEIGTLGQGQIDGCPFAGPRIYGNQTHLLPALRYFAAAFAKAKWGLVVFITDGRLDDLEAVKQESRLLAAAIAARRHPRMKCVIIGIGPRIDHGQLQELDDLDSRTAIDLWDHKIADSMKHLAEIFAELVDEHAIVTEHGLVRGPGGAIIKDYRDTGVPGVLSFTLPPGSGSFTLEVEGAAVTQPLRVGPQP